MNTKDKLAEVITTAISSDDKNPEGRVIYLACPYSSMDAELREHRFLIVCRLAARLMERGHAVFSPISHSHPIAKYLNNHNDSEFYVRQDLAFLPYCTELRVVHMAGWMLSRGVAREIGEAKRRGMPCYLVDSLTGEVVREI